jgi:hypothetical protein
MPDAKRKMLTVKMDPKTLDEFVITAKLRGSTMSALVYQFVLKAISEEKDSNPEAFGVKRTVEEPATRHEIFAEAFNGHELNERDWAEIEAVMKTLVDQKKARSD